MASGSGLPGLLAGPEDPLPVLEGGLRVHKPSPVTHLISWRRKDEMSEPMVVQRVLFIMCEIHFSLAANLSGTPFLLPSNASK